MKKTVLLSLAAMLLLAACHQPTPRLNSQTDTLAWALGRNTAESLLQGPVANIDRDLFLQAVQSTLDGKPQPLTDEQYREALQYLVVAARASQMQQAGNTRKAIDEAQDNYFSELVKREPNVKRHPAGFYYLELTPGHGPNAKYAQRILFDYRSFLMLTGEPYDQTYGKRDPILHVVGEPMFPGLIEAFQLMNAGSKFRFYFPYQNAFGEQGSGSIPPCTPLIYEIELHQTLEN